MQVFVTALRACALSLVCALAACGPNLGGLEKGEASRVAAAFNGDGLELESGLRVYLAEIDAPRGDAPYARAAQAELESLALNRKIRLGYGGQRRLGQASEPQAAEPAEAVPNDAVQNDTALTETALAHAFVQTEGGGWIWLQHALVSRGAAFVRPRRDNHERSAELFEAEAQARAAKAGLWAEDAYQIMSPRQAADAAANLTARCQNAAAPFAFVEGVIASVERQERRALIRFEQRGEGPAFALVVFGRAFAEWRGPDFESYEGQRVRVRGALETFRPRELAGGGALGYPQMCIDDSGQIELLS